MLSCLILECVTSTPFSDFSREFRVLVSTATAGSERVLSPGTDVVLKVVRMAVNEQFSTPMPMLYPGSNATDPRPFASVDAMWRAFSDLAHNKTPAVNGGKHFSLPASSTGARSSAPSGPRSAGNGRGTAECRPSRPLGRRDRAILRLLCQLLIPPTIWLDKMPNCWPLEEHRYAEDFAVSTSFMTDHPPSGAASSRPPPAWLPSEKTGDTA